MFKWILLAVAIITGSFALPQAVSAAGDITPGVPGGVGGGGTCGTAICTGLGLVWVAYQRPAGSVNIRWQTLTLAGANGSQVSRTLNCQADPRAPAGQTYIWALGMSSGRAGSVATHVGHPGFPGQLWLITHNVRVGANVLLGGNADQRARFQTQLGGYGSATSIGWGNQGARGDYNRWNIAAQRGETTGPSVAFNDAIAFCSWHGRPPVPGGDRIPDPPVSTPPETCTGTTTGDTHARTMNRNTNTWRTGNDVVWARPGDSVQFRHTYHSGAQCVRETPQNQRTPQATRSSGAVYAPRTQLFARNHCRVRATSPGANYLFDSPNGGAMRVGNEWNCAGDDGQVVGRTMFSPSTSNTHYSCPATGLASHVAGGYHIPGFAFLPSGCRALSASDLGQTIRQDMEFEGGTATSVQREHVPGRYPRHQVCARCWDDENPTTGERINERSCPPCEWRGPYNAYWYEGNDQQTRRTAFAQVRIPYNYTLTPELSINIPGSGNNRIGFGGTDVPVNSRVNVNAQHNPEIGDTYATRTKPASQYSIVSFIVSPGPARPGTWSGVVNGVRNNPCSFYGLHGGNCAFVQDWTNFTGNPNGHPDGSNNHSLWSGGLVVPDLEVGSKFCVALSVWPANSHGGQNHSGGDAMDGNSGLQTAHSEPSCIQIAKKPTLQVRSAGLFTVGGIQTSQTYKAPGFVGVGASGISENVHDGHRRIFGSWVEYEVVALKNVKRFGSGAAFGYNPAAPSLPGGHIGQSFNSNNRSVDLVNNCRVTRMSMANNQCNSDETGQAAGGQAALTKNISTMIPRLLARYCATGPTTVTTTNGNWTLLGTTRVICSSQNILVNGNIINNGSWSNIEDMGQYIIMAPNIVISPSVTRIDAWLVAVNPNNPAEMGAVDTCEGGSNSVRQHGADACNAGGAIPGGPGNAGLVINGPVFASSMVTMRTAGAGSGNASIDPAEIFNLRADTFLWAWAQSEQSGAIVTTFTRELAPRF